MKQKLLSLFVAACCSATIFGDNFLPFDWDNIPSEYLYSITNPSNAEYKALTQMKAACDNQNLYIWAEFDTDYLNTNENWEEPGHTGNSTPFYVYLNDGKHEGYNPWDCGWITPSAIHIEGFLFESDKPINYNPLIFQWVGEDSYDWLWEKINIQPIVESVVTDSTVELAINIANFSLTFDQYVYVGIEILKDWTIQGMLPHLTLDSDGNIEWQEMAKVEISPYLLSGTFINHLAYNFDSETKTATVIGCESSVTSITIPNTVTYKEQTYSVTTIGERAFAGCFGLTSVTIPHSVTTIGNFAFFGCSGIKAVTWNAKNCNGAYKDDFESYQPLFSNQVETFIFGDSVEVIPSYICYGMSKLTTITIPNSVTTIGKRAFALCEGLTSIEIPNSVTTIGDYAFSGCSKLTSVTIPSSVTTIGGGAFRNCSDLRSVKMGRSVTTIGDYAFALCEGLTSITIPNSVTTIGEEAFWGCTSLTSVKIPNSVTTIGDYAFSGCTSLTSVTIPNSVTTIGNSAFFSCNGLTSVTIPNSVTTIGENAFGGCTDLTSVTIPNSVTTIGENAFTLVANIVYNGTATGFPWGAKCINGFVDGYLVYSDASKAILCGCSTAATGKITIPNSVTTIGENAFLWCVGLTSLTIGHSVTMIGGRAFSGCSGLTSITIPNSVTTIGEDAFSGCTSLTSVKIPNSVTTIGEDAFSGSTSLTSVKIPNSVTTIGDGAFRDCSGLTSVKIPNSVTTIGDYAFFGCSNLTSVTFAKNSRLIKIGNYVFNGCSNLLDVTLPNSVIQVGE